MGGGNPKMQKKKKIKMVHLGSSSHLPRITKEFYSFSLYAYQQLVLTLSGFSVFLKNHARLKPFSTREYSLARFGMCVRQMLGTEPK